MRYSIELGRDRQVIVLRAQGEDWAPQGGQVELSELEVARYVDVEKLARSWRWVEFEPRRLAYGYHQLLSALLDARSPYRADVAGPYYNLGCESASNAC